MKKIITWIVRIVLALAAVFVLGALLIQLVPFGKDHTNPPVISEPNWDSPRTRELAQRACFDCHSNETVWPWYSNIAPVSWLVQRDVLEGRRVLNFSEWRPNSEAAYESGEAVASGWMPMPNYLLMHPNAALDAVEKDALIKGLQATARR